jgi:signal transduction histidine kinase
VPELFEPFRRLHAPRTGPADGTGLGLSIVASIAHAHEAPLTARPNPGGGLDITVRLGAAAPSDRDGDVVHSSLAPLALRTRRSGE